METILALITLLFLICLGLWGTLSVIMVFILTLEGIWRTRSWDFQTLSILVPMLAFVGLFCFAVTLLFQKFLLLIASVSS